MFNRRFNVALVTMQCLLATASQATSSAGVAAAQQKISVLAVPFVPNVGQWDKRAAFKANTLGGALFITAEGALVYSFPGKLLDPESGIETPELRARRGPNVGNVLAERGPGWALTETLIDRNEKARALMPAGLGPNEAKVSYFTGHAASYNERPINTYHRVQMGEVYPGVNLQLRATGNNVEKIFTVAPGRNPKRIQLKLDGAERLEINADGQLVAHTSNGPVSFTAPIAFQEDSAGVRESVTVAYALDAEQARYGFAVGTYDVSRALIIDPLLQSSYLGGSGEDRANAVTVHPVSGEVIVAGYTSSTNLPGATSGAQPVNGGGTYDAFISRFNASLTTLLQSSYLGGSGDDRANAVAVHPVSGEVIVAGYTSSTNLPGTTNGAQAVNGGGTYDAFISRFNAGLTSLLQSSFLGGSGEDRAYAVTVHPVSGEVIVAGFTDSGNLPGVTGGAQTANAGGVADGFVSRLNANLTARLQSTYLGGTAGDYVTGVTVHPVSGEVIVAGYTSSTSLPRITGGAQTVNAGSFDAFVSRLNANLTLLLQSSYLGGTSSDIANAVTVHPISGEVIVAGYTLSTNLPGTTGGAQATNAGGFTDAFVSRFNASLTALLQSSYLGGASSDVANAVSVHPASGEVIVAGNTDSTNLPGTVGGAQAANGGGTYDAFVSRFSASLTTLLQSSYLGGSGDDRGNAITIHPVSGEIIVAGATLSTNLPGTASGAQAVSGGGADAFISRFTPDLTANDTTPDPFAFVGQTHVPPSSVRTSNPALVSGLFGSATIYADGQLGSTYCVSSSNGCGCDISGGFVNNVGAVGNNQYICARHTASAALNQVTQTVVHIGGGAAGFSVSTGAVFNACSLDVDGNGSVSALTDGLMLIRAMLGFTGTTVTNGAIVGSPPRATWAAIQPFLNSHCGTAFLP